jgi:hypothetical protein
LVDHEALEALGGELQRGEAKGLQVTHGA